VASHPEVWLRGEALDAHPPRHLLLCTPRQAREEIARALEGEGIWARPGGGGSLGFQARHIVGSVDRLLTYAEGGVLSEEQFAALAAEQDEGDLEELRERVALGIAAAEARVRALDLEDLALRGTWGGGGSRCRWGRC
jgi:hypothetical protein